MTIAAGNALSPAQFLKIRDTAHRVFGLDLKSGKEALVAARVGKRLRELGLPDIRAYLRLLDEDRTGVELVSLIDALTTNFTSFQREPRHFDLFRREILAPLREREGLAVWSAGCATGEEPYNIAMHALDVLGESAQSRIRVLATDISTRALEAAERAIYTEDRLAGLPAEWPRRFFQRGSGHRAGFCRVKEAVRSMVRFRRLNLMEDFGALPEFDLIFCRNVMIYFDRPTQESVVQKLTRHIRRGGSLYIGHSEGLTAIRHGLEYVEPAVYRKP